AVCQPYVHDLGEQWSPARDGHGSTGRYQTVEMTTTTRRLSDVLSPRQMEILAWAAEGLSNAEIAARAFLVRRTVERHLMDIYARLGISPGENSHSGRIRAT